MVISYGAPENRLFHLVSINIGMTYLSIQEREHLAFNTNIYTIKKELPSEDGNKNEKVGENFFFIFTNDFFTKLQVHYVYVCKKKPEADQISQEKFMKVILTFTYFN